MKFTIINSIKQLPLKVIMIKFFIFFSFFFLTACQSEVDKCVDSQIASWKSQESRKQVIIDNNYNERKTITEGGFTLAEAQGKVLPLDTRSEVEVEAQARLACLKANK